MHRMTLNPAQLASFSLNLSSLMSKAGVYLMPQWLSTSVYYTSPMQMQEPMPPMQRFPGYETNFQFNGLRPFDPSTRPGDSYEQADTLFNAWRSLQGTLNQMGEIAKRSRLSPEEIDSLVNMYDDGSADLSEGNSFGTSLTDTELKSRFLGLTETAIHLAMMEGRGNAFRSASLLYSAAGSLEHLGEFDKAAMMAESAAHLHDVASMRGPPEGNDVNNGPTKYRVLAAKAWSTSVKVYRDFDRVDRFRLGRGIWNASHDADEEAKTMRELLSASADLYVRHGDMMGAISDRLRIAWHAVEAGLAPQGWGQLSSMLSVIAQTWETIEINKQLCDSVRKLAEDALKFSEQI